MIDVELHIFLEIDHKLFSFQVECQSCLGPERKIF